MGLLSKIGNAIKKVFKGVKKVFKKATDFVGRALKSKWGKALMLAAAVYFTAGAAGAFGGGGGLFGGAGIAAGGGAASAGGFFTKFVSGGKKMLEVFKGGAEKGLPGSKDDGSGGGGILSGITGFLSSPGGSSLMTVAGNVVKGYAEGKAQEEQLKEEERIRNQPNEWWRDQDKLKQLNDATTRDITTPEGMMNRARRVDEYLDRRRTAYPAQPSDPSQVYGAYATG